MVFVAVLALPTIAVAQSAEADATDRATVYEDEADTNGGIYGEICVGNLSGTAATRRAYVRFDLSEIPPDVVITRVVYDLLQVRARTMCATCPLTANLVMRRVLGDWDRGLGGDENAACGGGTSSSGVTWNSSPAAQTSDSAIQFLPASQGASITIDTDIGTDDDGLIADVQAWINDPASNYGWEYRVSSESTADNARLISPGSLTVFWTNPLEFEDGFETP